MKKKTCFLFASTVNRIIMNRLCEFFEQFVKKGKYFSPAAFTPADTAGIPYR